jgi:hypothetical protein
MRRAAIRTSALGAPLLVSAALALSLPAAAAPPSGPRPPDISTGGATHARGSTLLLTGSVNPEGSATTYYFEFGPTPAYGLRTRAARLPAGTTTIKVGILASPFLFGYHFRLVGTNQFGTRFGKDKIFAPLNPRLKIEVARKVTFLYGTSVVVSGHVTGITAARHGLLLQSNPFPYKEGFEDFGRPTTTNAAGRFVFRVGRLTRNTEFRVTSLDPLPHFSRVLTVHIAVRVALKVKKFGSSGFARFYGTVTPARAGKHVELQLEKEVLPGKSEKTEERTTRFVTTNVTKIKRATKKFSRFSGIALLRHTGRYRAVVLIKNGALSSGVSRVIVLRAPPGRHRRPKIF